MKATIGYALIVSGMVAGAFAAGSVLGNFTVAGLSAFGTSPNSMAALSPPVDDQGEAQVVQAAAVAPLPDDAPVNHVCEGCDARRLAEPEFASSYVYDDAPLPSDQDAAPQALAAMTLPVQAPAPAAPALPKLREREAASGAETDAAP